MMVDRRMKQDFHRVMTSMFGEDGAQQRRTVQAVINPDATVNRDGLLPVLPWSARDVFIPGEVQTGANLIRLAMPQGGRIRHVAIAAGTAPAGGPLALTLTGGTRQESVSLPAGQSTRPTGLDLRVDPGVFVGVTITAANGAENVTITLHYTIDGGT